MAVEFSNEKINLVLSNVNQVKREGKNTLTFVEFVDPVTYERTGDLMVSNDCVLPPKGTKCLVTLQVSPYGGRGSVLVGQVEAYNN